MSAKDLIVQHASAPGARLILLFHGVGSRPEDLVPLGRLLAEADPGAWVVSVCSPTGPGACRCQRHWTPELPAP